MKSIDSIWKKVTESIREKELVSETAYSLWIEPLQAVSFDENCMVFKIENSFIRDVVMQKYKKLITQELSEVMGFEVGISLTLDTPKNIVEPSKIETLVPNRFPREEYSFENFVVGPSNQHAYAACVAVSNEPGTNYNPLFIYGNTGLGKTHLLKAIQNKIKKNFPDFSVIYIKAEDFTTELIESIKNKTQLEFKNKYRNIDVLLIDDIQFISGKESTQEEFFHTFDALHDNGKQIILASDRPPKDMKLLEDRLRSRFESGIITNIDMPEYELKVAIIKMKAQYYNIELSDDVVNFMAMKIKNNIRQIEGAVKKMMAFSQLSNTPINVAVAQSCIKDIVNEKEAKPVLIEKIISEVCREYDVTEDDLKSKKRSELVTFARQVAMYLMKELTDMSLPEIGSCLGGRDHSTVHHSVNKIVDKIELSSVFKNKIDELIRNVKNN